VARKPDHREEREVSRKTIARGNVGSPPLPCMLVCVFCASCTRDRGCSAHPAFPAPSYLGRAGRFGQTSRESRGESAEVCHDVIARSGSDEAIHSSLARQNGLLRWRSQ
jgi:hypothetical protein